MRRIYDGFVCDECDEVYEGESQCPIEEHGGDYGTRVVFVPCRDDECADSTHDASLMAHVIRQDC